MFAKKGSLLIEALLLMMIMMMIASLSFAITSFSKGIANVNSEKDDEALREIYEP